MGVAMKLNQLFTSVASASKKTPPTKAAEPSGSSLTKSTTTHKSGKFFEDIEAKLKQDGPAMVAKVNAIVGFDVTCSDSRKISYAVDMKTKPGSVFVNDGCKDFYSFKVIFKDCNKL